MKVLIFDTAKQAVDAVAAKLVDTVVANPSCALGLATGGTVEPVYRQLVQKYEAGLVNFEEARTFNLDEYVGLAPTHSQSYHAYMAKHLFNQTNFQAANINIPFGNTSNPTAEARRYEAKITDSGGIDCQLLGIGENGHIGFNEPTSSLSSITRLKTLAPVTVRANSRYFENKADVPRISITMGIETILRAQEVVLLATGAKKSKAIRDMVEGPLSAMCPASALQMHRETEVYIDRAAAADLTLREYYEEVHPSGEVSKR